MIILVWFKKGGLGLKKEHLDYFSQDELGYLRRGESFFLKKYV